MRGAEKITTTQITIESDERMDKFGSLEEPLRGAPTIIYKSPAEWKKANATFEGPKRAIRLCMLCIVLPGLLIGVPLYLK